MGKWEAEMMLPFEIEIQPAILIFCEFTYGSVAGILSGGIFVP
jgi:hypothetical protein